MKMSPIKKIVICLAVVTVALSLITANNMASVMLIVASRQAGSATQQTAQVDNGTQGQAQVSDGTQGGTVSDNTVSDNTATDNTAPTDAASTDTNSGSSGSSNSSSGSNASSSGASNSGTAANSGSSTKSEKAEIIEYFNKAVNSVKTDAKSVKQKSVTNYLAGTPTIPSALNGVYKMLGGDSWLDGVLKDNSQGEAVYSGADIKAKFPVEGESYASKLTEADVASAKRTEANGVYTITITTVADAKSDSVKHGEGHAPKAFNVILPGVVNDNIPGVAASLVGTATMDYPSSTIVVTVDKATGKVLTADYDLKWTINFDKMGAVIPLGTKSSYTITY
ncbi:MAG: hypothetical protein ACI4VW_01645 [Acutalibacteraceae bacterium]